ncbi:dual 3',5'-cyclic-AMP and -GMP phosphodiesterase 11A-like [Lytechinus variegatus]|uniref:dual 3',5'-cyclic-AMP and -GMP phosphodiesterase 11A-like n=1 Tax=Lytechinus variegatus TaxID=7654 RepID=UPI001BB1597A|nr:dual 3',5'-cyclic-AMP and -GMP phosphodiesterase 11A-like [Lytechinus variegatus]
MNFFYCVPWRFLRNVYDTVRICMLDVAQVDLRTQSLAEKSETDMEVKKSEEDLDVMKPKQIEVWLDAHREWFENYFLKGANRDLVERWLDLHKNEDTSSPPSSSSPTNTPSPNSPGPITNQPIQPIHPLSPHTKRRVTLSEPEDKSESNSSDEGIANIPVRPRSGSRQYLRQDFAKARSKTVFSTWAAGTGARESSMQLDSEPLSPKERAMGEGPGKGFTGRRRLRRASTVPPPQNFASTLSSLLEPRVRLPHRTSITHEAKLQLRSANEREFFLALVKDISHDLDLNSLRGKILSNVSILVDAERVELFLLEGPKGKEVLVSKKRDLSPGAPTHRPTDWLLGFGKTDQEGSITVKVGESLVGKVAETGRAVKISSPVEARPTTCENCANFSPNCHVRIMKYGSYLPEPPCLNDVQPNLGSRAESLLCLPIRNSEDDVIGVALVINKVTGATFSPDDEKLLETYLTFCGIGISNAMLFDTYMKEYDRNRKLLEVAHDLFEEQTSLDNVVQKTMQRAQSLLKCERCSVMIIKDPSAETITFSKVFDLTGSTSNGHTNPTFASGDIKLSNGIIEQVAISGERANISDAQNDPRIDKELDKAIGFQTKSLLCMPIRDNKCQTIGVAQVLNRTDGFPFDENDEQLFEAFTIFCGLGINNTIMFNEVTKAMAKQQVALEVLSYHACTTKQEVRALKDARLPDIKKLKLVRFDFDDFSLEADEMLKASLKMYIQTGFLDKFKISQDVLSRWLLTVRKNYRPVAYHNFRHAFNVQQVMFAILQNTGVAKYLTDIEQLTLLVGCLCHDLDHRGTNNAYQEKSQSPLAQLYGSKATMEYHHFNHAVMILSSQGHNIFGNLSSEQYSEAMNILKHSIISTDLALHFSKFSLIPSNMLRVAKLKQNNLVYLSHFTHSALFLEKV